MRFCEFDDGCLFSDAAATSMDVPRSSDPLPRKRSLKLFVGKPINILDRGLDGPRHVFVLLLQ
jgi:hypothetical protein